MHPVDKAFSFKDGISKLTRLVNSRIEKCEEVRTEPDAAAAKYMLGEYGKLAIKTEQCSMELETAGLLKCLWEVRVVSNNSEKSRVA